jgi:hypothetical protein
LGDSISNRIETFKTRTEEVVNTFKDGSGWVLAGVAGAAVVLSVVFMLHVRSWLRRKPA